MDNNKNGWVSEELALMTPSEVSAFRVVLNCLECPLHETCVTSRRLFQQPLWQLAAPLSATRRLAHECQRKMAQPTWQRVPASFALSACLE